MHQQKFRLLLSEDKCLVLQPELVAIVGRSPALLLQQIHYWLSTKGKIGRDHNGQRWIYNSYEDWVKELKTLSRSTIHRALTILRKLGLIEVAQFSSRKGDRTNWYTINYPKISGLLSSKDHQTTLDDHRVKMTSSSIQNESFNITETNNRNNLINQKSSLQVNIDLQDNLEKEPNLVCQMLDIWNEYISADGKIVLTQRRAKSLMAALKYKFQNKLDSWRQYCQKIASSDFLMGRLQHSFKVTLEWALKFDTIQRIFENQFGVKRRGENQEPMALIELKDSGHKIPPLKEKLKNKLGIATYVSWFQDCHIIQEEESIVIKTPTAFHKEWIFSHFSHELEHIFGNAVCLQVLT